MKLENWVWLTFMACLVFAIGYWAGTLIDFMGILFTLGIAYGLYTANYILDHNLNG
jgi:uncharacterized membrane protein